MAFKDPPHDSAHGHVTGTSEFIDDRPRQAGELQVLVVYSTVAHGHITQLDVAAASQVDGVHGIYSHRDLAHNRWGSIVQDQPLLAAEEVNYVGEPILVIAAESMPAAKAAQALIDMEIKPAPAVLDIHAAKQQQHLIQFVF